MLEVYHKQKWLVYQIVPPEQGSEGFCGRYLLCVAEGNTKEEIVKNWAENVKLLYGKEVNLSYNPETDSWRDYYGIYANRLCDSYWDAFPEPIAILDRFYKEKNDVEDRYDAIKL